MTTSKKPKSVKEFVQECVNKALSEQQMNGGDRTFIPPNRQGRIQQPAQSPPRQTNADLEKMISGLQAQFAEIDARKLKQSKRDPQHSKSIARIAELVAEIQGLIKPIQEQNAVGAGGIVGVPNKAIELEESADVEQPTIHFFKEKVAESLSDTPWCKSVGLGIDKKTGDKVVVVSVDLNKIDAESGYSVLVREIAAMSKVPEKHIRVRGLGKISV